jgi:hypothetical protein
VRRRGERPDEGTSFATNSGLLPKLRDPFFTIALPTTTPSATFATLPHVLGFEMPKPTAIGSGVVARIAATLLRKRSRDFRALSRHAFARYVINEAACARGQLRDASRRSRRRDESDPFEPVCCESSALSESSSGGRSRMSKPSTPAASASR